MSTTVITGASDGIGAASARQLKARGHHVVIVGRSLRKTAALAEALGVPFHVADFSRLSEVRRLAQELQKYPEISVLANNAGAVMGEREVTEDGFEKTFQVNHLAPFLLTRLLLPRLLLNGARVIQTSSMAASIFGRGFDIDDLNAERSYRAAYAYGNAKLANILFTRELHRRYHEQGLSAVAFHPGVVRSNFASETNHLMRLLYHTPLRYLATISPESGGNRLTQLVEGAVGVDWQSGQVYVKRHLMPVLFADKDGSIARRLWDKSDEWVRTTQL